MAFSQLALRGQVVPGTVRHGGGAAIADHRLSTAEDGRREPAVGPRTPCPLPLATTLPHMLRVLAAVLLALTTLLPLAGSDFGKTNPAVTDAQGDDSRYLERLEKEAAEFRLERSRRTTVPAEDALARAQVAAAQERLAANDFKRARKLARNAFKRYRYTADTTTAGDLKRIVVISAARLDRVGETRQELARLWLFFPDYQNVGEAMLAALDAAERAQRFTSIVHLERDDPAQVIDVEGTGMIEENDKLFRFIATYGDRVSVGARARLGLARATLLGSDRRDVSETRQAYEDFLGLYPRHELTFIALTELALSQLVAYRGEHYDVGALVQASSVIDLAENETAGDPAKVALVQAYRTRIRSWHQDRDLQVARWYRGRHRPPGLAWLKEPSDRDWDDATRFYYREVVRRDSASPQGRAASRELDAMPAPRAANPVDVK